MCVHRYACSQCALDMEGCMYSEYLTEQCSSIVDHLEITYVRAGRAAVTLTAHARRRLLPVRGAHGSVLCFFI